MEVERLARRCQASECGCERGRQVVAAALGDRETAKQFSDSIVVTDPSFPGYEELEAEIAAIGNS